MTLAIIFKLFYLVGDNLKDELPGLLNANREAKHCHVVVLLILFLVREPTLLCTIRLYPFFF